MNKEEKTIKTIIEKYGKVPMRFECYYKYVFSFVGETEDIRILCNYGGNSDDIYRFSLDRDSKLLENLIDPEDADVTIKDKKTDKVILEFYNR